MVVQVRRRLQSAVPDADSALIVFAEHGAGASAPTVTWRPTAGSAVGEQTFTARATALTNPGSGNLRSFTLNAPTPGTGTSGAGQIRISSIGSPMMFAWFRIDNTAGYDDDAAHHRQWYW